MTATDRRGPGLAAASTLALTAILSLEGCAFFESFREPPQPWATVRGERSATPPSFTLRRVLVLPFTVRDAVASHGETMRAAFAGVLRDACGFDVVAPDAANLPRTTRDELLAGTGRDVSALIRLHREWDADAVLFGSLAYSRPHSEPAVGIDVELVDARDGTLLWRARDGVDAREPEVRASLLEFRRREIGADPGDASQIPFDSFTRFVAGSFVRTLFAPLPGEVVAHPEGTTAKGPELPGKRFPVENER